MTSKNWLMTLLALVLFVVYAVFFTDWFKSKKILISHTYRNVHAGPAGPARPGVMRPLIFGVTPEIPLTDIKVVPFDAYQTNKNIGPLWHLITDSNSVPLKDFFYGEHVQGMKPAIKGTHADDLDTNVNYLIIVHAEKVVGEHKFELH